MDVQSTAYQINEKILEIEKLSDRIEQAALEKANCIANYDRQIAVTILKLKNGLIPEFDGVEVKNLAANLIPIVAKGICYKESLDREMGENNYKGLITQIEAHKAVLNGYQSLFKVMQ
jgi:hypothetical protein